MMYTKKKVVTLFLTAVFIFSVVLLQSHCDDMSVALP